MTAQLTNGAGPKCPSPVSVDTYDKAYRAATAAIRNDGEHADDQRINNKSQTAGPDASWFKSDATPEELTHPGGVVEQIVNWIVSSAERPCRFLALSAALPFVGTLIGRRFSTQTDLRSNIYAVALAPSGFGKEHPRSQMKRLITAANLSVYSGPNRFMSASALRATMMDKPSCFSMVDEFGAMMKQITDPRGGLHNQLIRSDLLELFSSANSYFDGSAYAQTKAVKLHNPNLSLYGSSTPGDFWAPLSSMNTTDGLLARILLFIVDRPKPARVTPVITIQEVPADLVHWCQSLAAAGRAGGNLASNAQLDRGDNAVIPTIVRLDADAERELIDFKMFLESRESFATPEAEPVLNRAAEHAQKLALIVTVATDWDNPVTTGAIARWAINLAWHSTCCMIQEANARIADNLREANMNRISSLIKKAGKEGITVGQIADRTRSIDKRQRDEILGDLSLSRRIEGRIKNDTGGRPSARYFFVE